MPGWAEAFRVWRQVAIVNELRRLGQGIEHGEDWLTITPAPVTPAVIECYADHRIAMSFAVLGCAVPGVTIKDPGKLPPPSSRTLSAHL